MVIFLFEFCHLRFELPIVLVTKRKTQYPAKVNYCFLLQDIAFCTLLLADWLLYIGTYNSFALCYFSFTWGIQFKKRIVHLVHICMADKIHEL